MKKFGVFFSLDINIIITGLTHEEFIYTVCFDILRQISAPLRQIKLKQMWCSK